MPNRDELLLKALVSVAVVLAMLHSADGLTGHTGLLSVIVGYWLREGERQTLRTSEPPADEAT